MDGNNWRGQVPMVQPQAGTVEQLALSSSGGAPPMDPDDWRAQLPLDSRQRIVNKIMETLKKHLPFSGQEGLQELQKIAVRFEEKIYTAATSQSDYLRKISLKMLTMETKSQSPMSNSLQPGAANASRNSSDLGSHSIQSQIHNAGLAMPIVGGQSQGRQLLSQNMQQNNISAAGVQNSGSLASTLPAVNNLSQGSIANSVGQTSNLQNMQNNPNVAQNSVMGQGMQSNMFANSQRQMQGRQQQVPQQQQQQQQQNPAHLLYQQQIQQQLMKQKLQPGGMTQPMLQSQAQKQQQQHQNLIQSGQIQSSQQAVIQPTMMQSASLSGLQQNHQSSVQQSTQQMLEQQPQPVLRQHQQQQTQQVVPIMHQQQTSMAQQPMMQTAQQMQHQPLTGQVSSDSGIQQNQLMGQQNNIQDLQQQHRLMNQQNNIANLQQQQLISQQNSVPNMHQPQLGGGISGLQQSTVLGMQSVSSSGMPSNQHSVHMLQQKAPVQQQMQQNVSLLQNQTQQPQPQPSQQQMVSQIQPQSGQMPHLQLQSNPLQRDMQQRLPTSGAMLQQQNLVEQQKQFFQSQQRAMQEASSTSLDSTAQTGNAGAGDWQEEVYQKIKSMKDVYLLELNEMYVKIATKLQQHDALPQQPKNDQLNKLKFFKLMLERLVVFLRLNKNEIQIDHKDKLGSIEKQIINILNSNRPRKLGSLQPGQLQQPGMQNSLPQSQITHMQPTHDNQMNPHMQPMNQQTSATTIGGQNNISALHHNTLSSSVPSVSNPHQNMINSLQPSSSELGQNGSLLSSQQAAVNPLQQNNNNNNLVGSLTSQAGVNTLQSNLNSLQSNSNMLQNQHLRQQEQQMIHSQQLKRQMHHKQMQQQLLHNQQLMQPQQQQQQQPQQQQQQQSKQQQQSAQLPGHTLSPLHQITDSNDVKLRQQIGVKQGVFQQQQQQQQHHSSNQRAVAYASQQVKPGSPFSIPSPQVFQAGSPQVLQHPSPQINQHNLVTSYTKTGTPLQSANSPFIVTSPSTPVAPSPMHGELEKVNASLSTHPNTNIGHLQAANVTGSSAQSLAIGTPGISASPLLAEFTSLDGAHGNTSAVISGRSNAVERPIDRLIKAVKSASQNALSASMSDISSVVSMIDRIAGSAPGNGSRAAVGEDLVAMTKCRLQARNFFAQDGPAVTKKLRRSTTAMPSLVVSSAGSVNNSVKQLAGSDAFDLESTATSILRRPKVEPNHALLDEIHDINRRLIDTLVEISDEDVDSTAVAAVAEGGKGTIVKCSFTAVALSPRLKSQYDSAQISPIQPLRLLIPINYPNCSPILLDKFPVEISKEFEDLSMKAKSRFSISLRSLSQPMSLTEMAKTWNNCARAVISEYAQQNGGGSFSSKYGTWENCVISAS